MLVLHPAMSLRPMQVTRLLGRRERVRNAALAAALIWLLAPALALAHAELVSSTPADGSELASSPTEIRLVFSEAPRLEGVSVRLFDRRGIEVPLGSPAAGPLPTTVLVPLTAELRPGPYTVVWSVVSGEDEHPEADEFVFGIGELPGAPSVTANELTGLGGNTLLVPATLLAVAGLTLMIGASVQARFFGLDRRRVAWLALAGATLAGGALLAKAIGTPRGAATINNGSGGLLGSIDPGDLARLALVGLFAGVVVVADRTAPGAGRRRLWLVAIFAAAGLAWLQAASSHAAGVGILPWVSLAWQGIDVAIADPALYGWFGSLFEAGRQLNVLVAALHTVAVGAWIGGLLVVSLAALPAEELSAWHPRFSRFALRAFIVVAATGLYQAVLYLPSPSALVDSGYGRILLAKHVFVVGVLAIAAINRFVVGPALRRGPDITIAIGRARRALGAEALVGMGVLLVTGVLATTAPARPPTDIFLRPDVIARLAQEPVAVAGDRPGTELVVTRASSTQHRFELVAPGAEPSRPATLTLTSADAGLRRELPLRADGAGWRAEGLAFPRDGVWSASVTLAAGGEVTFALDVGFGRVMPYEALARRSWDEAIERTETGMRSARMIDQLTDGLSVMLFGGHEFVAPDRERFDIQGRFSSVTAGGRRYTRESGSDAWTVREAGPVRWPDFSFLKGALGVTAEGMGSQAGKTCQVLAGIDPQSDVTYEIWVGQDDGMIHRLVMGLPGHYMVNAYFDVNGPIEVDAPSGPISPAP